MGLTIKSDNSTDELRVDATSKAARVTGYRIDGTVIPDYATRNYYRASCAVNLVAAASTSPFFAIQGSASKVIRIISINFSGLTLTATAYQTIICSLRSTSINGGTSTALVQVPNDSTHPAGTLSICNVYTAAPTAGTLVGTIDSKRVLCTDPTSTALMSEEREFLFSKNNEDGVILRGITQGITLSFAVAPATAVTMAVSVLWSESDI
jgi:hypothetical protein